MQPTGFHRRNQAPIFVNHTPRFEITALNPSQPGPEMLGQTAMAIGAGPLYTNAIMGQGPSAIERENARKANSTILRQDTITIEKTARIEEPESLSRPDSFSMHFDCTDQEPYCPQSDSKMLTQSSLLGIPRDNASYDLADFLKITGPSAPHRRRSKADRPRHVSLKPKNALRFLRPKHKKSSLHEQ